VSDLRAIAELHEELSTDPPARDGHSLVLHTCERAEIYSVGPPPHDFVHRVRGHLEAPPAFLTNRWKSLRRLTEIAAGVRSRLLGERFVYEQVRRAVLGQADDHLLWDDGLTALRIARAARTHHGFDAEFDYPELARRLLQTHGTTPAASSVLVVGGGMVAQAVVTQPWLLDYKQRAIMTRSPKKLRRRLPDRPVGTAIVVPRHASAVTMDSWDVIVATVNITGTYRATVESLVRDERCRFAVDLSSVPLYDGDAPAHYAGLYGAQVSDLIERHNVRRTETAAAVRAYVRDALDRALTMTGDGGRWE
jgi:glutamyl-tRNA reductase